VAITTGLMLRSDKLGVTSIIRDLALAPGCYEPMLHFFRVSSWSLEDIRKRWYSAVSRYASLYKEGNLHVLVGDGVKQSKEGRRMPGVKKLFQESGNSAKPGFIHGHMFGGLGILAGSIRNWACIPLSIRLHDGLQAAREWEGASVSAASHVVQMVEDAYKAALTFRDSLLLLDRYFLTVPVLKKLRGLNASGAVHMDIVTKAKKPCTAYQKPGPRKPGRGRPPKKGEPAPLKCVKGEKPRRKVLEAVRAIEMHMVLSCIAMGILQSLSIRYIGKISSSQIRYQRTPSKGRVSEATLMHYFRKHFFRLLGQEPGLRITQIIQGLQKEPGEQWDSMVS